MEGLIPEYDEREAARFGGYTWAAWQRLPREERLHGVAYYRVHTIIGIHMDEAARQVSRTQTSQRR